MLLKKFFFIRIFRITFNYLFLDYELVYYFGYLLLFFYAVFTN
jgi:hypothetical protein